MRSPSVVSKATAADSNEANFSSAVASDTTLGLLDNFTSRWSKTTDRSGVGVRITSAYPDIQPTVHQNTLSLTN
jgi:hypothetical protein